MNILKQIRQAQQRITVATLGRLKIGETFEFVTRRELHIGDMVNIQEQHQPVYGIATITKVSNGLYEAKRTK